MKHGIEIFGGHLDKWIFVEADSREQADDLQLRSSGLVPTRRVIQTDEGHVVRVHATE